MKRKLQKYQVLIYFFSEKEVVGKLAFQKSFFSVVVSTFFRKNWFWDRYLWWKTFCFELKIFSRRSKFVRKIAVAKSVFWVNFYPKNVNVGVSMLSWKALFWEKKTIFESKVSGNIGFWSNFSKPADFGPTPLSVPHVEPTFQIPSSLRLKFYERVRQSRFDGWFFFQKIISFSFKPLKRQNYRFRFLLKSMNLRRQIWKKNIFWT